MRERMSGAWDVICGLLTAVVVFGGGALLALSEGWSLIVGLALYAGIAVWAFATAR